MSRATLLSLLGASVLAAGGALIITNLEQGKTYQALAYVDCLRAKADAGVTPVDCVAGDVAVPIKLGAESDQRGYEIIPGTEVEVAKETLPVPRPQPLVSDCIAGELRRDTSSRGDGSQWWYPPTKYDGQCERARLQCRLPDKRWVSVDEGIAAGACIVFAGQEFSGRPLWQDRLREKRPETAPIGEVEKP